MHILNNNGAIYMTKDFNFNQALDNYYREVTAEVTAAVTNKTLLDQQELNDSAFPCEFPKITIELTECDLDEFKDVVNGAEPMEWSYTDQYGQTINVVFTGVADDEED
jgi:aspartate oxidase